MNHPKQYDAIIIGAGGAGLNLLLAMHTQGFLKENKVLVIEPSKNVSNNRTWCFWAKPEDTIVKAFNGILHHQWDFAKIEGHSKKFYPYRYYHLKGIDFYQFVYHCLGNNANVVWHPSAAEKVETKQQEALVTTSTQDTFAAPWVFDSRLNEQALSHTEQKNAIVWQSFFGYRIKTQTSKFDTQALSMMDFDVEQQNQCQFVYLLPFSNQEALVELTRFGAECLDSNKDEPLLREWILQRFGEFEIVENEVGRIPMSIQFNPDEAYHPTTNRLIPIGTAAGAVKSTTGYAFLNMFYHAFDIVKALQNKKPIPHPYHNIKFSFYDQLLLIILKEKPHWGKEIFRTLFKKVALNKILKFLNEDTNVAEDLGILTSLPKRYFLWALSKKSKHVIQPHATR